MSNKSNYEYLLSDLTKLKGVGAKTTNLLKKKKINNIFDCYGSCPNPIRIEVVRQKLRI
jgi:ATP-dependent DNA helicase RecG